MGLGTKGQALRGGDFTRECWSGLCNRWTPDAAEESWAGPRCQAACSGVNHGRHSALWSKQKLHMSPSSLDLGGIGPKGKAPQKRKKGGRPESLEAAGMCRKGLFTLRGSDSFAQ